MQIGPTTLGYCIVIIQTYRIAKGLASRANWPKRARSLLMNAAFVCAPDFAVIANFGDAGVMNRKLGFKELNRQACPTAISII